MLGMCKNNITISYDKSCKNGKMNLDLIMHVTMKLIMIQPILCIISSLYLQSTCNNFDYCTYQNSSTEPLM